MLVNKAKSYQKSFREGDEQIPPIKILLVGKNSWVIIAKINMYCQIKPFRDLKRPNNVPRNRHVTNSTT